MGSASVEQIERQFAQLPVQLQLSLLERLQRQVEAQVTDSDDTFANEIAAMANDPEIIAEVAAINAEFHLTERDGLNGK
jgi:hypothetical protein